MSSIHKRGPVTPQMNMTPLIDVTFLLIIFFMIVSNIVSEQTVEMIVPDLDDSKAREFTDESRVVVNVAPEPFDRSEREITEAGEHLTISGEATGIKVGTTDYATDDLVGVTDQLERAKARNEDIEVLLRADAGLFYREVQGVMGAIAGAGIARINLVAYRPEE